MTSMILKNKEKKLKLPALGFTLIELLAVIVILGIILLIATPIVLNVIDDAKKGAFQASVNYLIKTVENEYMKNQLKNIKEEQIYEYENGKLLNGKSLDYKGNHPEKGIIVLRTDGKIGIAVHNGIWCAFKSYDEDKPSLNKVSLDECTLDIEKSPLVIDINEDGVEVVKADNLHTIISHYSGDKEEFIASWQTLDGEIEESYVEFLKFEGNLTISSENTDELGNVFFGKKESGTDSENMDKYMLFIVVNGDLTIEEDVTLTPNTRKKGMFIYVDGDIINNGEISMTARGAYAYGQNIMLYKNEFVPAVGALGGAKVTTGAFDSFTAGNKGHDGEGRMTGGGGSGVRNRSTSSSPIIQSGAGGTGTSYSGGTGGGAVSRGASGGSAEDGNPNGGKGGDRYGTTGGTTGGGVGNPSGTSSAITSSGTGGLLVVYSESLYNNGEITANGVQAATTVKAGGGSSGGGSINIFYQKTYENNGIVEASGGLVGAKGGAGGTGSVSILKME